jgi:hypothetical protein
MVNAFSSKEGGQGAVEELPTPVGMEALHLGAEEVGNLSGPHLDGCCRITLVLQEVDVPKARVIIHNGERVLVPLGCTDGCGSPEVHVDNIQALGGTCGI